MSLSPAAGVEEGWPTVILRRGVSVLHGLSDEHFDVWFRMAISITRRQQSFHVELPQCDSNYIVVCRGRIVAFVKAMSSSSVEVVDTDSLDARRWNGFVYTTLFSNGTAVPAWARDIAYATRWWEEGIRATYQPLQDAILETGSRDVCVYVASLVVPGGSVWIPIWRVSGGLYSIKMLGERELFRSGQEAFGALQSELQQVIPGLRVARKFTFLGLRANPEPHFPRTRVAPRSNIDGNMAMVEPSPLTRVPKVVRNGSEMIRCSRDPRGVVRVNYGRNVCITVDMPDSIAREKERWRFSLGTDGAPGKFMGSGTWSGSLLECTVLHAQWAALVETTDCPWYTLQIWSENATATLAVPVHQLTDLITGHGMHSTAEKRMKPCMLLTHDEFVGLPAAVGTAAVVAVAVTNAKETVSTTSVGGARPKSAPKVSLTRSREIGAGVRRILAARTRAAALSAFTAVLVPTRRHVAAAFERLVAISEPETRLEGKDWSLLLASCARRMHRLTAAAVVDVVTVLCRCDCLGCQVCCVATPISPGDNNELLAVISALKTRGLAAQAKRVESKHIHGSLRYLVVQSKLPISVAKGLANRRLGASNAWTFLRLIASEEGETVACPEWKTSVRHSLFARQTGQEIWAMANSDRTMAVQRALPSQRRRIAAELGVLAIERNAVRLGNRERWEVTPALMTAV